MHYENHFTVKSVILLELIKFIIVKNRNLMKVWFKNYYFNLVISCKNNIEINILIIN